MKRKKLLYKKMLLLLFKTGAERFALPSDQVVEIVPFVKVKKIPMAPKHVTGLMNFRGQPVPVVDLCLLLLDRPCEPKFNTRIILIAPSGSTENDNLVGLVAEEVTKTIKSTLSEIPSSGVLMDQALYEDGTGADTDKMVQWFDLKKMLPAQDLDFLFQGQTADPDPV